MSKHDLQVLDTFETADYMKGELSDEGMFVDILLQNYFSRPEF